MRLLCMVNEANFIKTLASADVIAAGHPLSTAGMEDLKGATLLPPSGAGGRVKLRVRENGTGLGISWEGAGMHRERQHCIWL